jgi:hypothetical protein
LAAMASEIACTSAMLRWRYPGSELSSDLVVTRYTVQHERRNRWDAPFYVDVLWVKYIYIPSLASACHPGPSHPVAARVLFVGTAWWVSLPGNEGIRG